MKKRLIALLLVLVILVPASIASAAGWYRVNTSSVKVRLLDSESAKVLGSYRRDYALTVKSTKNGWSYVVFSNGFEGYVQSRYITKSKTGNAWVTADSTALRRGPDGSFAATAYLAKGRKVKVLSYGTNYNYVDAGSMGKGYIVKVRLSSKKVKASGSESETAGGGGGGNYDAYVINAGARKVNLRTLPSLNAPVIASYPTTTKVHVITHGGTWDKVEVNGNTGYMMTKFLTTSVPATTVAPPSGGGGGGSATYTAYIICGNKGTVNVRKGPGTGYATKFALRYGTAVTVVSHGTTWDKIEYNGRDGYIMNKFLQTSKPEDAGEPTVTSTPAPVVSFPYETTVRVNGLNFHKQKGDWSSNVDGVGRLSAGMVVTVIRIEGGWAYLDYNGYKGWVHKEFLN